MNTNIESGLTPEEQLIIEHLVDAWNLFIKLPMAQSKQSDFDSFSMHINELANIFGRRALARIYPDFWSY